MRFEKNNLTVLCFQKISTQKKDLELFPSLIFHMKLRYLQTRDLFFYNACFLT